MTLIDLLLLGFFIGLSGALAPGPTLIVTIQKTLHLGWTSGPRITLGHIIVEFCITVIIVAGLSIIPSGANPVISEIGGAALCIFGFLTIKGSKNANLNIPIEENIKSSPEVAGIISSITNPYFWIWWFSVGSALLISSLSQGFFGLVAFINGHWMADLSWYTLVSLGVHKSRTVLNTRMYRIILIGCGILLVLFGLWFMISGFMH